MTSSREVGLCSHQTSGKTRSEIGGPHRSTPPARQTRSGRLASCWVAGTVQEGDLHRPTTGWLDAPFFRPYMGAWTYFETKGPQTAGVPPLLERNLFRIIREIAVSCAAEERPFPLFFVKSRFVPKEQEGNELRLCFCLRACLPSSGWILQSLLESGER